MCVSPKTRRRPRAPTKGQRRASGLTRPVPVCLIFPRKPLTKEIYIYIYSIYIYIYHFLNTHRASAVPFWPSASKKEEKPVKIQRDRMPAGRRGAEHARGEGWEVCVCVCVCVGGGKTSLQEDVIALCDSRGPTPGVTRPSSCMK